MTYVVNVPIEVQTPVSETDPDVRSLSRLPGFISLQPLAPSRYELRFEIEGGSLQDATDAADQLVIEYEDALRGYHPTLLAPVLPQQR
jgi:hypothetical protein